jgi:DNA polymerase IV
VEDVLFALSEELAYRLWSEGYRSRTLGLKLRLHDFTTVSRRTTRRAPYGSSKEAYEDALSLLDKAWDGRSAVRLLGLCFAELEAESGDAQGELFPNLSEKARRAESAAFEIERRGLGKLTRARLVGRRANRGRPDPGEGSPGSP